MSTSMLRVAARSTRTATRALSMSAVSRKDFVQELYIKELKAYKPPVSAKDAHVGSVKEINLPKAPSPPELPADLASELATYEATQPTLADAAPASTAGADSSAGGAQAFLAFLEQDIPKDEVHH